jgi:hypothetical protein
METGMTTPKRLLGAMMALIIATSANAQSASSPALAVNFVLVHGALVDGSSWRGVYTCWPEMVIASASCSSR